MPKVSVIIPTFNRADCIERSIKSAQYQTLEDIEILVCDDGSVDATRNVVRRFQVVDNRIKLFCLPKNQGAGAARNLGMVEAQGEYIAFLDSDDEWLPEKLTRQVELMDAVPPNVGVCFCGGTIIKNKESDKPVAYIPKMTWEDDSFRKFVMGKIPFLTPTVLFRRSCLRECGLMIPEMRRNQDGEFLLRLLSQYGLRVISEPYAVIHLVIATKSVHYDAVKAALPYRLAHRTLVKEKLGSWTALRYACIHRTNLLHAAIRERRIGNAGRDLGLRLLEFPLLFPEEVMALIKSALVSVFRYSRHGSR